MEDNYFILFFNWDNWFFLSIEKEYFLNLKSSNFFLQIKGG